MPDRKPLFPTMTVPERRHEILKLVREGGRVSVAALSERFGVSAVTIRQDLQALAAQNLIIRTHGGAIPGDRLAAELSLAYRRQQQVAAKDRIGAAAAALIQDGDAVFLDTSSTALAIARRLEHHRYVTVITNSLAVVQELMAFPHIAVVVPGGHLRRETVSLIGREGLSLLEGYNIEKGFFGAHGLSLNVGLTDVSPDEAAIKAVLVGKCREVNVVIDATKWGRVGIATFAPLTAVHRVITDTEAPAAMVAAVQQAGIEVLCV